MASAGPYTNPRSRQITTQASHHNRFTTLWILSGTTGVSQYQKTYSPTHTYRGHQSSLICFLHLLWSIASSLINLCAWQSFSTISLQVFFGASLDLAPSTSYSIYFFTQSFSSSRSTCPYHCNLFCCSTEIMLSNPSLSLNSLLGTLSCSSMPRIHLTILIFARQSATSFFLSYGPGLTSMQHTTSHTTAVQSPSHNQRYIFIGKQWYQLPEFIPYNSNSGLHTTQCLQTTCPSCSLTYNDNAS